MDHALLLALLLCGAAPAPLQRRQGTGVVLEAAGTPHRRRRTAPKIGQYVALGDSYTAAPLVPVTDVANGCFRSDHNYPALAAKALGAELEDRSCGGARTADLPPASTPTSPPS